jgi:hypothetical protein
MFPGEAACNDEVQQLTWLWKAIKPNWLPRVANTSRALQASLTACDHALFHVMELLSSMTSTTLPPTLGLDP